VEKNANKFFLKGKRKGEFRLRGGGAEDEIEKEEKEVFI